MREPVRYYNWFPEEFKHAHIHVHTNNNKMNLQIVSKLMYSTGRKKNQLYLVRTKYLSMSPQMCFSLPRYVSKKHQRKLTFIEYLPHVVLIFLHLMT